MSTETVILEKKDGVGHIVLNRPDKGNALNDAMAERFFEVLHQAEQDEEVRVVVIRGAGKHFCSGWETGKAPNYGPPAPGSLSAAQSATRAQEEARRWQYLYNYPKGTVALVSGDCLGAGCNIALACHLVIADREARFGDPSIADGHMPPTPLWFWVLGSHKAKQLVLTGQSISGAEAEQMALIYRALPADKMAEELDYLCKRMAGLPLDGAAIRNEGFQMGMDVGGLASAWKLWSQLYIESCIISKRARGTASTDGRGAEPAGFKTLQYKKDGAAATIALARADVGNAVDDLMFKEIRAVLALAEKDSGVKVVVMTGAGADFCTGRSLAAEGSTAFMLPDTRAKRPYTTQALAWARAQQDWWEYVTNFPKPLVARVTGRCLDLGCHLALACDIVLAADDAQIGDPEMALGLLPPTPLWVRAVGIKRAKEIMLAGQLISGQDAVGLGLAAGSYPRMDLDKHVTALVERLAALDGDATAFLKTAVQRILDIKGMAGVWRLNTDALMFRALQPFAPGDFPLFDMRERKGFKTIPQAVAEADSWGRASGET